MRHRGPHAVAVAAPASSARAVAPPAIEAATYAGSAGGDIYHEIATIDLPVRILRAKERDSDYLSDMSRSPTTPDLAQAFKHAEDVYVPRFTHFIPMQDPRFVADQIRQFAG